MINGEHRGWYDSVSVTCAWLSLIVFRQISASEELYVFRKL